MSSAKEAFGIDCPDGGEFYTCEGNSSRFVGCCTSDPCGTKNGTCADGDLRITSFNASSYERIPVQDCNHSQGADNWYVCASSSPPFMGCCSQNACGRDGCPTAGLIPAKLSSDDMLRSEFLYPRNSSTATSTDVATSVTASNTSGTSHPTHTGDSSLSASSIIGIAVGAGVGGLLIIIVVAWLFWWRPRQKKKGDIHQLNVAPVSYQPSNTPGNFQHSGTFAMQSPPGSFQHTFLPSPVPEQQHSPSVPVGQYKGQFTETAEFEHPQSYTRFSNISSIPPQSPGLPSYVQVTGGAQMAPVHEMDGTTAVCLEMSTGQEHRISRANSP